MTDDTTPIPAITWTAVETLLLGMATTDEKRLIVRHLIEGTRKQAPFLTSEGIYSELFYIAAALLDSGFKPPRSDPNSSDALFSSSASPP